MARILIVDDTRANAELLEAHLDGTGHETRIATNGEEALREATSFRPDVVLLGRDDAQNLGLRGLQAPARRPGD